MHTPTPLRKSHCIHTMCIAGICIFTLYTSQCFPKQNLRRALSPNTMLSLFTKGENSSFIIPNIELSRGPKGNSVGKVHTLNAIDQGLSLASHYSKHSGVCTIPRGNDSLGPLYRHYWGGGLSGLLSTFWESLPLQKSARLQNSENILCICKLSYRKIFGSFTEHLLLILILLFWPQIFYFIFIMILFKYSGYKIIHIIHPVMVLPKVKDARLNSKNSCFYLEVNFQLNTFKASS